METDFFWDQKATDAHVGATRRLKTRSDLMWAAKPKGEALNRLASGIVGDYQFKQELIAAMGCEPTRVWRDPQDALHFAAALGHEGLCRQLLSRGWSVNGLDRYGASAFEGACAYRQEGVARLLAESGLDVNHKSPSGDNPLHLAARELMPALCKRLLELGARPEAINAQGETAVLVAIWELLRIGKDPLALPGMFGEKIDITSKDIFGHTALHMACSRVSGRKEPEWIEWLAKRGVELSAQGRGGESALSLACARDRFTGHETAVQLLALGADPDVGAETEAGRAQSGWGNERAASLLMAWREAKALDEGLRAVPKQRGAASL